MSRRRIARAISCAALAAGAVLCAACAGSLFQSKAVVPAVYLLSAQDLPSIPAAAPPVQLSVDLAVLRPRVRMGLETDRIAVLYPDRRLDYFADARWSGPLDELMQDLTLQAFHAAAHLRNVSADASAFPSGYWLEIEVANFQAEYTPAASAPTIHVQLLARLGGAADRHVLGTFDAAAFQPAADNRLTAIVDAYQRATSAALAQLVANTTLTLNEILERR